MPDGAILRVRLTPRGGRDALTKFEENALHARVAAPPVDGAANRALLALLAEALDIPKSRLSIQSGETSRVKMIRIEEMDAATLEQRLNALLTRDK